MPLRTDVARLSAVEAAAGMRGRMVVVQAYDGEDQDAALSAAGIIPHDNDVIVLVDMYATRSV